jgi:hypothetical protein
VQSNVHEFRQKFSAMKQEKSTYASSGNEALNDGSFKPRGERSEERLGVLV